MQVLPPSLLLLFLTTDFAAMSAQEASDTQGEQAGGAGEENKVDAAEGVESPRASEQQGSEEAPSSEEEAEEGSSESEQREGAETQAESALEDSEFMRTLRAFFQSKGAFLQVSRPLAGRQGGWGGGRGRQGASMVAYPHTQPCSTHCRSPPLALSCPQPCSTGQGFKARQGLGRELQPTLARTPPAT